MLQALIMLTEEIKANHQKKYAPFKSCISKVNNTFIENAEDLDIAMPMHNLLEYSNNYSMTLGSLKNYYRDEVNDDANGNNDAGNYRTQSNKTATRQQQVNLLSIRQN